MLEKKKKLEHMASTKVPGYLVRGSRSPELDSAISEGQPSNLRYKVLKPDCYRQEDSLEHPESVAIRNTLHT
jgi:hypothetical protein